MYLLTRERQSSRKLARLCTTTITLRMVAFSSCFFFFFFFPRMLDIACIDIRTLGVEQSKMSIWCERNGKMWRTLKPYLTIKGTRCQSNPEWLRLARRIALLPSGVLHGPGPLSPTPTRTPARDLPALNLIHTGRAWSGLRAADLHSFQPDGMAYRKTNSHQVSSPTCSHGGRKKALNTPKAPWHDSIGWEE